MEDVLRFKSFLAGSLAASLPWAFFLEPTRDFAPKLLPAAAQIYCIGFSVTSLAAAAGYAAAGAIGATAHGPRIWSAGAGAICGSLIVWAIRYPIDGSLNFGLMAVYALMVGAVLGVINALAARRLSGKSKAT